LDDVIFVLVEFPGEEGASGSRSNKSVFLSVVLPFKWEPSDSSFLCVGTS